MKELRMAHLFLTAALFGVLLASGCTVKKKGVPHANQPPKVFFSAIPISGTIFSKPDQFFWYATDRDGYIVEFQYALQPDSLVGIARSGAKADSAVRAFLLAHPIDTDTSWHWVLVDNLSGNGQTDTIALPTSRQDSNTINSVVFVRAKDDRGLMSSASSHYPDSNSIAYRLFGRKNRGPETYFQSISVCNKLPITSGLPTLYSLPADNYNNDPFYRVGHCGITIRWIGDDSLDYPNQPQPPLDYFWELFGPFATQQQSGADTNRLWASTTYPDRWPGRFSGQSPNRRTFTSATSMTFFGLHGVDTLADSFPGYYVFRVRARDDAGVIDSIGPPQGKVPATFTFRAVRPRFDRKILLICKMPNNSADTTFTFTGDASPVMARDSFKVQNYYINLIREAGYGCVFDSARDVRFFSATATVPESLLARYKLVIFHKDFVFPAEGQIPMLASLKAYMDAGGGVWGMGRDDLTDVLPAITSDEPEERTFDQSDPNNGVGYFYFGAERISYSAHSLEVARDSISREEFIGAEPLLPGFPILDLDTALLRTMKIYPSRKDRTPYRQLPGVNYFVRGPRSDNLYLFRSPIGVADTSHLNGKVVAFRSDRGTFKTAFFGFPLYFIQEPGAVEVTRKMLEWFLGPPGSL